MSDKPKSHQIQPDSSEYVSAWAKDLETAVGKRELRKILADYKAIADNKRLAKRDRDIAAERVKALKRLL